MQPHPAISVVLSTCPPDHAERLASLLVERRLAACVNILAQVRSVYRWEGRIEREDECLLVIKLPSEAVDRLVAELVDAHPYDVPEVIALPVSGGNPSYLRWVCGETAGGA
ncbi:MAG: divalent-cation tolerance protein CutA [Planctomycetes bacterium]|nr:divalent-cation tolerance protein CutA [Planctomycetota bacterium]